MLARPLSHAAANFNRVARLQFCSNIGKAGGLVDCRRHFCSGLLYSKYHVPAFHRMGLASDPAPDIAGGVRLDL
ncbi:MAG TPA: hypothetical protein VHK86_07450 [Nitrososphaera sp.]|nr:hypothetical protein [Nitrososphaera sp.]